MRSLLVMCLVTSLLVVLCGCKDSRSTTVKRDACSLISKEEVESVQATPVNETKSSERSDNLFYVSQCFYTTAESSKSVSLALVQENPDQQNKRTPKDFWKREVWALREAARWKTAGEGGRKRARTCAEKDRWPRGRCLLGQQSIRRRALCFERRRLHLSWTWRNG
jgi:hypothetical protein